MADAEALQKQVDALSSALGHLIEAVQELHGLQDVSQPGAAADPRERRIRESVRLAIANMDELNRLRVRA
jgi:hypothetical protein